MHSLLDFEETLGVENPVFHPKPSSHASITSSGLPKLFPLWLFFSIYELTLTPTIQLALKVDVDGRISRILKI